MAKIDADPESEDVKHTESVLWQKIYKKSGQGRRTGVGITAEGDMLAALGLRYGTEEATEFAEQVHKTVALSAYRSSVVMAKERGAFEVYDSEREKNNPFINRLREADPELYEEMKKYGRRNIACLTIAPTGTTSLMTQTTSGIEPVFLPVYKRRRKVNPNDSNVHIDFVDETGDAFEEYIVFHPKFVTWMEAEGYDPAKRYTQEEIDALVEKSPYYKATSNDVDWLMKVKMQGRIQKWVDHSISVTINLPNDVDEELVNRLYVEAWKSGCKGCTVYRDGSRSGVLISTKSDKKNELPPCKPPTVVETRPKVLEADVVRFQNNKENGWHSSDCWTDIPTRYSPVFKMTTKASSSRRMFQQDISSRTSMRTGTSVTTSSLRTNAVTRSLSRDCPRNSTRNIGTTPSSSPAYCVTACLSSR